MIHNKIISIVTKSLFLLAFFSLSAESQENIKLTHIQGEVLVGDAGQFKPITIETFVNADTKILVQKSSSAQLIYPNGCSVTLQGNSIYKAGNESNCKQGAAILVGANDSAAVGGASTLEKKDNNNKGYLILGAGAIGIGAAAAMGGSHHQNSTPSP
jgi:hypothetical protein